MSDNLPPLPAPPRKRRGNGADENGERYPYKLTPERQAQIVLFLKAGCYTETAARAAGVRVQTLRAWLKRAADQRARGRTSAYTRFLDAVSAAMAQHEGALLATISKASAEQWTAAAWLLERRFPGKYEPHRTTELEKRRTMRAERELRAAGSGAGDLTRGMTEEEVRALARRYLQALGKGAP